MSTLTDDMRLDLVNHLKDDLTDIEHRLTTASFSSEGGNGMHLASRRNRLQEQIRALGASTPFIDDGEGMCGACNSERAVCRCPEGFHTRREWEDEIGAEPDWWTS